MDSVPRNHMRRAVKFSQIGWTLLLWLGVVWFGVCFRETLLDLVFGPVWVDAQKLCRAKELTDVVKSNVRIEAGEAQRLFAIAYSLGKKPYAVCALVRVADAWMLVQMPEEHTGRTYSGTLEALSPYDMKYVVPRIQSRYPGKRILPFRLNMTRPFPSGLFFPAAPLLVLLLVAIGHTLTVLPYRSIIRNFQCEGCPRR